MKGFALFVWELVHTARSLLLVLQDWLILRTPIARFIRRDQTFAFLVHPRTDDLEGRDVYGYNDIYRPIPAFRHFFKFLPQSLARKVVLGFVGAITPSTLSRMKVRVGSATVRGYLLTSARMPSQLIGASVAETKAHLDDLFLLAARKGVRRVGLGALLPSMTGYGRRFTSHKNVERPAVSTGHAYTAYNVAQYLRFLTSRRDPDGSTVRVAIVGAGGSTGRALMRVLKMTWNESVHLDLMLVDVAMKAFALQSLAKEAIASEKFPNVRVATDLNVLHEAEYVVVVTNATRTIIRPEHLRPGTVVIDDSQPRNTSPELTSHGCYIIDVLARVPGLDCNFDFGFVTQDRSVTFTCLAETLLATVAGDFDDLAVGEVTDDVVVRMLRIVKIGTELGLVGPLPFFSFGRELTTAEQEQIFRPAKIPFAPAAE